jgi:hypothetical protein
MKSGILECLDFSQDAAFSIGEIIEKGIKSGKYSEKDLMNGEIIINCKNIVHLMKQARKELEIYQKQLLEIRNITETLVKL